MTSHLPPLRAAALGEVRRALLAKEPAAMSQLPQLFALCETQLAHEDSFVYQVCAILVID